MNINEDDLLRECMSSGQMTAEQVMQHWGAGELMTAADDQFTLRETQTSRAFSHHVKTTLDKLAKELGISQEALRESAGSWHQLPSGARVMLIDAKTRQRLAREEVEKVRADLSAKMLDDFMAGAKLATTFDESTELKPFLLPGDRKTCLSCGAKQAADGTLWCGH